MDWPDDDSSSIARRSASWWCRAAPSASPSAPRHNPKVRERREAPAGVRYGQVALVELDGPLEALDALISERRRAEALAVCFGGARGRHLVDAHGVVGQGLRRRVLNLPGHLQELAVGPQRLVELSLVVVHDPNTEVGLGLRLPPPGAARREGEVPKLKRPCRRGPGPPGPGRPGPGFAVSSLLWWTAVQERRRIVDGAERLQDVAFDRRGGRGEGRPPDVGIAARRVFPGGAFMLGGGSTRSGASIWG